MKCNKILLIIILTVINLSLSINCFCEDLLSVRYLVPYKILESNLCKISQQSENELDIYHNNDSILTGNVLFINKMSQETWIYQSCTSNLSMYKAPIKLRKSYSEYIK